MKKNIILIGMPGVGKSTVGVVLAKVMGYQFIDADLVIQEKEGKLLREIIAEVGPEGFLKVENRINSGNMPLLQPAEAWCTERKRWNILAGSVRWFI